MPTSDVTLKGLAVASAIIEDNIVIGGDILIIRPLTHCLDGIFLSYQIRSQENQILQLVTGTTVYHIYTSNMRNFEFFLPPIGEQRAIAQVLNDVDALIVALGKLIDKKKIITERANNPEFYDRMSQILDEIIKDRKSKAFRYEAFLKKIAHLAKKIKRGYEDDLPEELDTYGKKVLYENLSKNLKLTLKNT